MTLLRRMEREGGIVSDREMIFRILLLALCLAAALPAAASPDGMQDVGGDFGRKWLEGQTAGGPEPAG